MWRSLFLIFPLLAWRTAGADMLVELDVDSQVGNGPDTIVVTPEDSVVTDVWIVGDDWGPSVFWYFGIYVVDNGALDFLGGEILLPPPWQSDPIAESGDTVFVWAYDLTLQGDPGPALKVARLLYRTANEEGIGTLGVDLAESFYMLYFATWRFTSYVGAQVVIEGTTGTDRTTWGAIKTLFR